MAVYQGFLTGIGDSPNSDRLDRPLACEPLGYLDLMDHRIRLVSDMQRRFFVLGALYGFLGVALGAFGAHALKSTLSADAMAIYRTAVEYHLVHALALLFAASRIAGRKATLSAEVAAWGFAAGTLLFSGSLYVLAVSGLRFFGAITPLGGVSFLVGWGALAYDGWRRTPSN